MISDPWSPIPVAKGKPLLVCSDREPILTRTIPRVPTQEMMLGTTATQSSTERVRIRSSETEAEGALLAQRTRTTSSAPVITAGTTFQTTTTSSLRIPVERIGNEAGEGCESPTQIRRIAALTTACEELSILDDVAEARQVHLEKLTKVKDAIIKVAPRTDATTKPRRVDGWTLFYDEGARKTRCTTRGYEQTPNGSEDFSSAAPATIPLKTIFAASALKGHVAAIGDWSGTFCQSLLNPDGTERKVWIELLETEHMSRHQLIPTQ